MWHGGKLAPAALRKGLIRNKIRPADHIATALHGWHGGTLLAPAAW